MPSFTVLTSTASLHSLGVVSQGELCDVRCSSSCLQRAVEIKRHIVIIETPARQHGYTSVLARHHCQLMLCLMYTAQAAIQT